MIDLHYYPLNPGAHVPAPRRYPIPATTRRVDQTIERSRFVTSIGPAPTVEDARAFIDAVRDEFPDATHNCWAYVVGPPGDTGRVGMSDAGEPHGTAGRPMLTVLLGSGVGDVVAVVTRYYGGRKLGKGGLVRAYGGGVKLALESLALAERVRTVRLRVRTDYPTVTPLKNLLPEFEAELVDAVYGSDVTLEIELPEESADRFEETLAHLTNGRARVTRP